MRIAQKHDLMAPKTTFILLWICALTIGQVLCQEAGESPITDPRIGLRCQELLGSRAQKIKVQQKAKGLISRNNKLLKRIPLQKKTLIRSLERTGVKLRHQNYLLGLQIASTEEHIIRSGCPGLALSK